MVMSSEEFVIDFSKMTRDQKIDFLNQTITKQMKLVKEKNPEFAVMFALTFAAVKIHEEQFLKKMVGQMALDEFCANIILIINNICFYLIYSFIKKKKKVFV